jgi:phage gp36-like protein
VEARVGGPGPYLQLVGEDPGNPGHPDPAVEGQFVSSTAQTEFDAELNSYLRRAGYAVPVSETAFAAVKDHALSLLNYRLKTNGDRIATDDDRTRNKSAEAFFAALASSKVVLIDETSNFPDIEYGFDSQPTRSSQIRRVF